MTLSELKERYRRGCSVNVLAELCDMLPEDIAYVLEQCGVEKEKVTYEKVEWSWNSELALSLYKLGLKDLDISRVVGVSRATIGRWRLLSGLPRQGARVDKDMV